MTHCMLCLSFFVAMISLRSSALAELMPSDIRPAVLNPGDQYRLAFVTSTTRDMRSSDIGDYNAFVSAAANTQPLLAGLGTTWTAIASTQTVNAIDNTATSGDGGVPIFLLDGVTKIADNYPDLWDGMIAAPLNVTETGAVVSDPFQIVWTLTTISGVAGEGTFPGGLANVGDPARVNFDWVSANTLPRGFMNPFYGLSAPITVLEVPESADLNMDGFVDGLDLGILLGEWDPAVAAAMGITREAAVPEPTSTVMLTGLAAIGLFGRRGRSRS